jgi:sec-independent protein translocase protein TatA
MPGPTEWLIVGAVVLLLFGAKKLPDLARSLGRSSSEFKKGIHEGSVDEDEDTTTKAAPQASSETSVEKKAD